MNTTGFEPLLDKVEIKSAFQQLQALDVRAGKLIGNAEFVHEQGDDVWSYALGLGTKIVLAGVASALLQCLIAFVGLFHDPGLSQIAACGYALSLILIASSFYPREKSGLIVLPLAMTMALSGFVGLVNGIVGIPTQLLWTPAYAPVWSMILGVLIAMYIFKALYATIQGALSSFDAKPRLTMNVLRKEGLLTLNEGKEIKHYKSKLKPYLFGILASELWCCLSFLLLFADVIAGLVLFVVGIVFFVVSYRGYALWHIPYRKLRVAILERLISEGTLREINIPADPKPSIGYELRTGKALAVFRKPSS